MMRDIPQPIDSHQASRAYTVVLQLLHREEGYERAREIIDSIPDGSALDIAYLHKVLRTCSPMSRPVLMQTLHYFQEWSYLSLGAERHNGTEDN